jgi:hypothetical protein
MISVSTNERRRGLASAVPPAWLQKAWANAKARGLDMMTLDEITAEIAAHRESSRDAATSTTAAALKEEG